jgi:tRNA A-37 threonylcarbamoyl transferase component Bud32
MDIIHSDLHESNILVQKNKNNTDFFISDFGLSKTKKDLFNKLKKNDYRIFVDFNSNYYIIQYLSLILKILEIKFIK